MFGYEAPTGRAKIWRLDSQGKGFTKTADRPMQLDWTAFTTWSTSSGSKLLGYKIRSGLATTFVFDANGTGISWVRDARWSKGWR